MTKNQNEFIERHGYLIFLKRLKETYSDHMNVLSLLNADLVFYEEQILRVKLEIERVELTLKVKSLNHVD